MAHIRINSEVAGTIWKVLVEVGDKVAVDTPVALVESMKMEIPVLASADGVFVEVFLKAGDPVAEDQAVLAVEV